VAAVPAAAAAIAAAHQRVGSLRDRWTCAAVSV
jgi:hypothetical protein